MPPPDPEGHQAVTISRQRRFRLQVQPEVQLEAPHAVADTATCGFITQHQRCCMTVVNLKRAAKAHPRNPRGKTARKPNRKTGDRTLYRA